MLKGSLAGEHRAHTGRSVGVLRPNSKQRSRVGSLLPFAALSLRVEIGQKRIHRHAETKGNIRSANDAQRYITSRDRLEPFVENHWHDLRILGFSTGPEVKAMVSRPWSPATEVAKLERDFEETLDHFMSHDWGVPKSQGGHHPTAIESFIHGDRLVVRAELPGIDPKDVQISVDDDLLTIQASRLADSEEEGRNFVHREIRYGSFARTISIPKGVRREDISTAWHRGVLELTVPLPKGAAVRRVPIEKATRPEEPETG